jgi:hypothetical protein
VRNDASKALNAAVDTGASRDEIKHLQEELEYAVTQIRQSEWMFALANGKWLQAVRSAKSKNGESQKAHNLRPLLRQGQDQDLRQAVEPRSGACW